MRDCHHDAAHSTAPDQSLTGDTQPASLGDRLWRAAGVEDHREAEGAAILVERNAILVQQIPIMYMVLLVNVATLAAMSSRLSSPILWLGLPIVLSLIVVTRLAFYARNKGIPVSPDSAARQQRAMVVRTVILSTGYSLWVVDTLGSGDLTHDAIAAMLSYVSALGSAYCMATLPGSAKAAVLIAPAPVSIWLLCSGEPILIGLGANLVLAAGLALRLLTRHHQNFVEGVRAKQLLAREGARARNAEAAAARLARTDALTGLLNRRGFFEILEERCSRHEVAAPFALALLDCNGFKAVNDTYGHPAGDELLVGIASRLGGCAGQDALVSRLGGDEFAALIEINASGASATSRIETMCQALKEPFILSDDVNVRISACYGLAFSFEETELSRLLALADRRLYQRKHAWRKKSLGPARSAADPHSLGGELSQWRAVR